MLRYWKVLWPVLTLGVGNYANKTALVLIKIFTLCNRWPYEDLVTRYLVIIFFDLIEQIPYCSGYYSFGFINNDILLFEIRTLDEYIDLIDVYIRNQSFIWYILFFKVEKWNVEDTVKIFRLFPWRRKWNFLSIFKIFCGRGLRIARNKTSNYFIWKYFYCNSSNYAFALWSLLPDHHFQLTKMFWKWKPIFILLLTLDYVHESTQKKVLPWMVAVFRNGTLLYAWKNALFA